MAAVAAGGCLLWLISAQAAEYFTHKEKWPSSTSGWLDRDAGKMAVSWANIGSGGALNGAFAAQGLGFPESDAFRATNTSSSGKFVGDYRAGGLVPLYLRFGFIAQDVLPSAVQCRLRGAGVTFFWFVTNNISALGTWYLISVPLDTTNGWVGGTETEFSNTLSSVDWVEVQVTRNGTSAQNFNIANFSRVSLVPDSVATNDADHNGIPDYWEQLYGIEGLASTNDSDGDFVSNGDEYLMGTNPQDASSLLQCYNITSSSSGVYVVMFDSADGRMYQLKWASAATSQCNDVAGPVAGADGFNTLTDTNSTGSGWYLIQGYKP